MAKKVPGKLETTQAPPTEHSTYFIVFPENEEARPFGKFISREAGSGPMLCKAYARIFLKGSIEIGKIEASEEDHLLATINTSSLPERLEGFPCFKICDDCPEIAGDGRHGFIYTMNGDQGDHVFSQATALAELEERIKTEEVLPEDAASIKRSIQRSKLPKERTPWDDAIASRRTNGQ